MTGKKNVDFACIQSYSDRNLCPTEHGWNDPPLFSFSSLQSGSNKKSQMTKRVNHVVSVSSPDSSTSSALDPHKKNNTSIPPLLNSGLSPSGPPPPPPTAFHTEKDITNTINVKDDMVENPGESEGVLTRGSNEEPENRIFDQVLASLAELTDKHCETVQVTRNAKTIDAHVEP